MSTDSQNPYIGPRTFRREEGHLFFGRDKEAADRIKEDLLKGDRDEATRMQEIYQENYHAQIFDRRTVDVDGEPANCIANQPPTPGDSNILMTCETEAGLLIVGHIDAQNIDTFYSVVSQMRKHKYDAHPEF